MANMQTTLRQLFEAETVSSDRLFVGTDETGYTWRTNSFFVHSDKEGNKPSPLKAVKGVMKPGMTINKMDLSFMCPGGLHQVQREFVRKLIDTPAFVYDNKVLLLDKKEVAAYSKTLGKRSEFNTTEEYLLDFHTIQEGLFINDTFLSRIPEDVLDRCVFSLAVSANKLLILHIQDDTGMLYKALMLYPEPMYMQLETSKETWIPSEWDQQTKHYRKVDIMFKLPELKKVDSNTIEQASNDAVDQLMEELDIQRKDEPAKDEQPKKEPAKKVQKKEAEQKPVEEVSEAATAKETGKEVPKEDEDKPKRVNKPKKTLRDLKPIIEEISSTVPDDMDISVVLNEIRQLRDLIKVACCRSSNLSTVYLERTTAAVKTLKEVSCLLSQKI